MTLRPHTNHCYKKPLHPIAYTASPLFSLAYTTCMSIHCVSETAHIVIAIFSQ